MLSEAMEKLLNRGFNFSILPLKLDLTQVLVDFRKFERSVLWHEFWHNQEIETETKSRIFKSSKTNLPPKNNTPENLKVFLSSVKSEILDYRNRNNVKCNLPNDELQAVKELIKLQKD